MNKKINDLKEVIEKNKIAYIDLTIEYIDLTIEKNKLILFHQYSLDQEIFEITLKNDCFYVFRKHYSEITNRTEEENQIFHSIKEVLNFID